MDFSKDYEIKIYKNNGSHTEMESLENEFYLEEVTPNAKISKQKILKAFSNDFRKYFNCDGASAFSVYTNNQHKTFLINYRDYEAMYAVGAISLLNVPFEGNSERRWVLNSMWVHPFMRRKHLLKNSIEILEKKYKSIFIKEILSYEMERYALKYNKEHSLHFRYELSKKGL